MEMDDTISNKAADHFIEDKVIDNTINESLYLGKDITLIKVRKDREILNHRSIEQA